MLYLTANLGKKIALVKAQDKDNTTECMLFVGIVGVWQDWKATQLGRILRSIRT